MKKILYSLLILGVNLCASELYVNYSTQVAGLENINVEMRGATVGYSWGEKVRIFIEGNMQSDSEKNIDYYDVVIGLNGEIIKKTNLRIGWNAGIGIGIFDVPWYSNKNRILSLPAGLTFEYAITDVISLNAHAGYKYFFDLTDDEDYTVCNDGTLSESTGPGTCSWHGGIAGYTTNDLIGDGGGMSWQLGLSYKF